MITAAWRWLRAGTRAARWRWLCVLGLLTAIGWTLHAVLPPTPRWRLAGYHWLQGFTDGGRTAVVTTIEYSQPQGPGEWHYVWVDVDSGRTVRKLDVVCSYSLLSPKFNTVAAGDGKAFWFLDTATGRKTTVQGEWGKGTTTELRFSRSGRWLIRKRDTTAYLFDTATGAIHKQWDGVTDQLWHVADTERFVLSLKDGKDERLATWDAETDTELGLLGRYRRWHALGQHDRFVIGSPAGDDAHLHMIDLHEKEVVLKLPAAKRTLNRYAVSDDGRHAAFWFHGPGDFEPRVEIWDLRAGIKRSETRAARSLGQAVFAPDGARVVLFQGPFDSTSSSIEFDRSVPILDVATGRELWRASERAHQFCFSADSRRVGMHTGEDTFEFFDAATGAPRQAITLFPLSDWTSAQAAGSFAPRWSSDRRYLVFCNHDVTRTLRVALIQTGIKLPQADEICVLDVKERRVAANLRIKGLANQEFTTHGPTVLTCQEDSDGPHLTAWDVPPRKRWLWIAGGPALLGVVVLGYGRWRRPPGGRCNGWLSRR